MLSLGKTPLRSRVARLAVSPLRKFSIDSADSLDPRFLNVDAAAATSAHNKTTRTRAR